MHKARTVSGFKKGWKKYMKNIRKFLNSNEGTLTTIAIELIKESIQSIISIFK